MHLNNNVMCSIAIKTNGPHPETAQILDLAIVPVNSDLNPIKEVLPFHFFFKPERNFLKDPEMVEEFKVSQERLLRYQQEGYDADYLADRLEDWFEDHLDMRERKKIVPLAYDWPFVSGFLRKWLGPFNFDHFFDYRFRDLLASCNAMNDLADLKSMHIPFEKLDHTYLTNLLDVEREPIGPHYALNNAVYTIECYKRMLRREHHAK